MSTALQHNSALQAEQELREQARRDAHATSRCGRRLACDEFLKRRPHRCAGAQHMACALQRHDTTYDRVERGVDRVVAAVDR